MGLMQWLGLAKDVPAPGPDPVAVALESLARTLAEREAREAAAADRQESLVQEAAAAEMQALAAREQQPPPQRPTCSCGSRWFSGSGTGIAPLCDGRHAWFEHGAPVMSCFQCGKRWYLTPEGLREPHPDAMPPAWAAMDMQREAVRARDERARDAKERARDARSPRPIEAEFRRPR